MDEDMDFLVGSPIATVTLCEEGAARQVTFKKYGHTGEVQGTVSQKTGNEVPVKSLVATAAPFVPQHGSLYLIMYDANHVKGDEARTVWKHGVEAAAGACGVRYGLTYRCISTTWDVTNGEVVKGDGERQQAVPLNIVDRHWNRVNYDGQVRWGATSTPVMEYPEAVAYAAICAEKIAEKKQKAEASLEKKLAKVAAAERKGAEEEEEKEDKATSKTRKRKGSRKPRSKKQKTEAG
jgi:hypothetical protein